MNDELGQLFFLDEGNLVAIDTRPVTQEEADDFVLSSLQSKSFYRHTQPVDKVYWVPLTAFKPMLKTGASELTKDDLICTNCGYEIDEFLTEEEDD